MSIKEDLKLERYKFVINRQGYFTDLAKQTFNSYTRIFFASVAGTITLISLRNQLKLDDSVVISLLDAIVLLLFLTATISVIQIFFCLKRWYGFRDAECSINREVPKPESWAWLFEGMYCVAIIVSVLVAWWGVNYLEAVLAAVAQK